MQNVSAKEIAVVVGVGLGIAAATTFVPLLNERKVLTRTVLYTLGNVAATQRPTGGYAFLKSNGA